MKKWNGMEFITLQFFNMLNKRFSIKKCKNVFKNKKGLHFSLLKKVFVKVKNGYFKT